MTGTIAFNPGAPEEGHFIRIRLELRPVDHQNRRFQSFMILDAQINLMTQFFNRTFQLMIDEALIGLVGGRLSLKNETAAQIIAAHLFQLTQGSIAIAGIGKQNNRE